MKLSAAAVKAFMDEHNRSYPYNDVPCTRQCYYPKWLLATSKGNGGIPLRKTGYCTIKTSCLSHDNVQNLIMAGDTLPLPAVFGEVVDSLETWGANCWTCWL